MSSPRQSGFDIGDAVNSAAEWLSNAPIIHRIVNNPIYTALLITALVAVVAIAMYRDYLRGKKAIRALIYTFFLTSLVVFVHHYAIVQTARESSLHQAAREVFAGVQSSREMGIGGTTPVVPLGETAPVTGGTAPVTARLNPAPTPPRASANVAPFGTAPGDKDSKLAIDDAEIPFVVAAR